MADLSGVKPGDKLIETYHGQAYSRRTVERITTSGQIVLKNGMKYAPDGHPIGESHSFYHLHRSTPELEQELRYRQALAYVSSINWEEVDEDIVLQVARLLKSKQMEETNA